MSGRAHCWCSPAHVRPCSCRLADDDEHALAVDLHDVDRHLDAVTRGRANRDGAGCALVVLGVLKTLKNGLERGASGLGDPTEQQARRAIGEDAPHARARLECLLVGGGVSRGLGSQHLCSVRNATEDATLSGDLARLGDECGVDVCTGGLAAGAGIGGSAGAGGNCGAGGAGGLPATEFDTSTHSGSAFGKAVSCFFSSSPVLTVFVVSVSRVLVVRLVVPRDI